METKNVLILILLEDDLGDHLLPEEIRGLYRLNPYSIGG